MSDIAIRADGLGKFYRIGTKDDSPTSTLAGMRRLITSPFAYLRRMTRPPTEAETHWALKDVSFEINRGDVVGVIGRNGAGKSTLLKILSRITEPSCGRAEVHGRVGSLLEVGTGFHPELTGRENIFLNGAILGMRRAEIERKFDEIVAFSGVERFLDTPVKRYSSGMYVRLAFAVAAHLETEILLVDEVLAVGDAEFQNRCLGKMDEIAHEGRTVLFVSHSMSAVQTLCRRGILIANGTVAMVGSVSDAIRAYESFVLSGLRSNDDTRPAHVVYLAPPLERPPDCAVSRVEVLDHEGLPLAQPRTWDTVRFRIHYHVTTTVENGSIVLRIGTPHGLSLLLLSTQPDGNVPVKLCPGQHYADIEISSLPLSAGEYVVGAGLAVPNMDWLDWSDHRGVLRVSERDVYGSGLAPVSSRSILALPHQWNVTQCP